jgi:hypothetical protein
MYLNYKKYIGLLILFSATQFNVLAQQQWDSVYIKNKHQLGINASKFIAIFNEQVNSLELNYRYRINYPLSLRTSLSYDQNTADDGLWDASFKIGIDRQFKSSKKWIFYHGIDAYFQNTIISSSERTTLKVGGFIFIGILRYFGSHFSIATEPNFSILYVDFKDPTAFSTDANRSWTEYKLGNIGHIQLNFHF